MALISNADLWNSLRKGNPNFASQTSEVTSSFFTSQSFESIKYTDLNTLNDWYTMSMRVWLDMVNISEAKDPLAIGDMGEVFDRPYAFYIQRMAIDSVKPISPSYKNIDNGASIDPFVVRKGKVEERFFQTNFDYQSLITIPDEYVMKTIFVSEFGMSEFMAGLMTSLENGWTIQRYVNKLEAINKGINSTKFPAQESQSVDITLSPTPTQEQLKQMILTVNNTITAMTIGAQTNAFNSLYFNTVQDKSRLRLLVRPGFKNAIKVNVLSSAFNPTDLGLDVTVLEVENFGGLVPYKESAFTTLLYPTYDKLGTVIGYAETKNANTPTVEAQDVFWKDPNESVVAVLADKGWIFESLQNGYRVEPIRNPRGLYTNYWASCPNNFVGVDPIRNFVKFVQKAPANVTANNIAL